MKTKTPELALMKGRRIAARMLIELERVMACQAVIAGMNPYSLFAVYRYKGEAQDNIVLRHLQQAGAHGDECVAGFCAALSDHCANAELGSTTLPKIYLRVTEQEINEGGTIDREQTLRELREFRDQSEAKPPGATLQ